MNIQLVVLLAAVASTSISMSLDPTHPPSQGVRWGGQHTTVPPGTRSTSTVSSKSKPSSSSKKLGTERNLGTDTHMTVHKLELYE